jgi:hypothetical protein
MVTSDENWPYLAAIENVSIIRIELPDWLAAE